MKIQYRTTSIKTRSGLQLHPKINIQSWVIKYPSPNKNPQQPALLRHQNPKIIPMRGQANTTWQNVCHNLQNMPRCPDIHQFPCQPRWDYANNCKLSKHIVVLFRVHRFWATPQLDQVRYLQLCSQDGIYSTAWNISEAETASVQLTLGPTINIITQ